MNDKITIKDVFVAGEDGAPIRAGVAFFNPNGSVEVFLDFITDNGRFEIKDRVINFK